MTNVQTDVELLRTIDDDDAEAIGAVHSVYGIQKIRIAPGRNHITVDYGATRFSSDDVSNVLVRCGVPIVTPEQK